MPYNTCHNDRDQVGNPLLTNPPQALLELLRDWQGQNAAHKVYGPFVQK